MKSALNIKNISKNYQNFKAVDDLSFDIKDGEIFGLLGPNGAGKSTTIGMLAGATKFFHGSIEIFGLDIKNQPIKTKAMTGVMPQEAKLDNFFNVSNTIDIQCGYLGFKVDPIWKKYLMDKLELAEHSKKKPIQLSGGMSRRLMIAKSLIHKPKLLVLDEPTAGVDVELRRSLWDLVRKVNSWGTSILLTTHYLEEAESLCNRIGIMNNGKLISLDTPEKITAKFKSKIIIFELTNDIESPPEFLSKFNPTVSSKRLSIELSAKDNIEEILKLISQNKLSFTDMKIEKPALEDAFIELTKENN